MRLFFNDEGGFTSAGVAVALALALALLFTSLQVYWAGSTSDDIQFAADAGALAGEDVVAEYMVLARVADAVALSLGLLHVTLVGGSIVASCIPGGQGVGASLLDAAESVLKARTEFAQKARESLNTLEKMLPLFCVIQGRVVIQANSAQSRSASYQGIVIPLPLKGEGFDLKGDDIEDAGDEISETNQRTQGFTDAAAEDYERMKGSKERAYQADCGNAPGYCLYERSSTLAGLSGRQNPFYHSVDTWEFSAAITRARAYYRLRYQREAPMDNSLAERVRSAARLQVYGYAVEMMRGAYARVDQDGRMDANFPQIPRTVAEVRGTSLYTEMVYPVGADGNLHACASCPGCSAVGRGSLAQQDGGAYGVCPYCDFSVKTVASVASASSRIQNGFEYHYRIIAEAAAEYQEASRSYAEKTRQAKSSASRAFDRLRSALEGFTAQRLDPKPPGRYGCIALVVDLSTHQAPPVFQTSLLSTPVQVGPRAAISASAMATDTADEGGDLLSSFFDKVQGEGENGFMGGIPRSVADKVFSLWSKLLQLYGNSVEGLEGMLDKILDAIPGARNTPLSRWSGKALGGFLEEIGFQPAVLDTPKPVVVNTSHVLAMDGSSFAQGMLAAKKAAGMEGSTLVNLLLNALGDMEGVLAA